MSQDIGDDPDFRTVLEPLLEGFERLSALIEGFMEMHGCDPRFSDLRFAVERAKGASDVAAELVRMQMRKAG
jgi:hypothetical protein